MPHVFRRVILKPAGLPEEDCARLREALAGAVELQGQLSASPHVLQLNGGLQETQHAFYVEHEPGEPLAIADLFNPEAPLADETHVLRLAIALADAFRTAHERSGQRRAVHGGFCAGTVIETPDGIHKVADFGIAPAVCSVLGAASYTELAVTSVMDGPEELRGTGVWEVLSPEEETRDDRLCGFIAPEKYASQAFETFEPGSDIVAAGILLHLVAEHQHPLIGGEGEHRTVDMAAQMGFWLYNGARRKDFRESENPAVKVWCDLVARMLANSPQQRPTAPQIVKAFAEVDVKPVDAAEMLNRAVEAAAVAAKEGRWDEVRETLAGIADRDGVPEDVAAKVKALLREADCHSLIEMATSQLSGDDWQKAAAPLSELESSGVPSDIAQVVEALSRKFRNSTEANEQLDKIHETLAQLTEDDAQSASTAIDRLIEEVEALSADGDLVAQVETQRGAIRETLLKKREALTTKLEALSAEHEEVQAWFKKAKAAWKEERWNDLEAILSDRPATPHWPHDVTQETESLQKRFAEVQAARTWLEKTADPLDAENLDALERLLSKRPEVSEWPEQLRAQIDEVDRRIASIKSKAAELARAHEWIDSVERAVAAMDWSEASRLLVAKPTLKNWPTDIPKREKPLRQQVEKHLEDVERERLAIETWLSLAAEAAKAKDWSGALEVLDAPTIEPAKLPKKTRKVVVGLRKDYTERLKQQQVEELSSLNEAIRETASELVGAVVRADLSGLLDPKSVHIRIDPLQWNSNVTPTEGSGQLHVTVGADADGTAENSISRKLQIKVEGHVPRIIAEGEIKSALSELFLKLVKSRQQTDFAAPLRAGFFPDAKADMKTSELATKLPVSIFLLGPKVKEAKVNVQLVWDPVELNWRLSDPADFTRRAVDIAVDGTRPLIKPAILERSELLRQYESVLVLNMSAPVVPAEGSFPDTLTFGCSLKIHPRGKAESPPLQQVPILLPQAGRVVIDADLSPAEAALRKILVDTQEAGRTGLAQTLTARVKQAAMRIKLVSLTKQIKRPVEEVGFELRVRRAEPLVVLAPWDVESFEFGLPESAETALQELFERQSEVAAPMLGKRVALIGGVAAMGAAVVAGAVYWPKSDVAPPLVSSLNVNAGSLVNDIDNIDNANNIDNTNANESTNVANDIANTASGNIDNNTNSGTADTTPAPSVAAIRDELSAILAQSSYLDAATIAQHRLVNVAQVAATEPAVVKITIPGVRVFDLTLAPPTAGGDWQPTESDTQQVVDGVAALDKLLDDSFTVPIAGWIDAAPELAGYLVASQASVSSAQPTWNLDESGDRWSASDVEIRISIETDQGSEPVASLLAELSAQGDLVRLTAGQDEILGKGIVDALVKKVVALQKASLQQQQLALENDANVNPEGRPLSDNSATTGWPTKSLQLSLAPADWMQQRNLTLNWDSTSLAFQFDTPSATQLDQLPAALAALQLIRSEIARPGSGHWLGTVSKGDGEVKELQPPTSGMWSLELTSVWDDSVKLPVEVAVDLSGGINVAIESVNNASGPWYEPLVDRLASLSPGSGAASLSPGEVQSLENALAGGAGVELASFLAGLPADSRDAYFAPQYVMQSGAVPTLSTTAWRPLDPSAEYLSVRASLRIAANHSAFADPSTGFDPDKLDQRLADGSVAIGVRLKVGQAASEIDWGDAVAINDALESFAKLAGGLTNFIDGYPGRVAAESSLEAALADANAQKEISPDVAYRLLKEIWRAKGIDFTKLRPGEVVPAGDLSAFSVEMRNRWSDPRGKIPALKRTVSATVFMEYFCGIDSVYAIAWSVGLNKDLVTNGPYLVKLFASDVLSQAAGQPVQDLGASLLRPVLELVSEALDSSVDPFRGELGIVIATDDLLPNLDTFKKLKIFPSPKTSFLLGDQDRRLDQQLQWNSLAELGPDAGEYRGSFAIRQALLSGKRAKELRRTGDSEWVERFDVWDAALSSLVN